MNKFLLPLVRNESLAPGSFLLTFECAEIAAEARAGQFVGMLPSHSSDPLLRRPFSICTVDRDKGEFTVLIKVIGPGTRMLSEIALGASVDMLAPLGLHFEWQDARRMLLVAGGVGVAPLLLLCQEVREALSNAKPSAARARSAADATNAALRPEIVFCYGARTASEFVLLDRIEPLVDRPVLTPDDGS
ncbi:hypothetical protein IIC65_03600, partial [Candidatus Sumerlaeota bacterium]|nr:hypothetical protein [Candidatus Sumerlaeota bacterium]